MKWLRRRFGIASETGAATIANVGEGRFDFEVSRRACVPESFAKAEPGVS
jgi:hypothetical protein